jgi:hypothetical protein
MSNFMEENTKIKIEESKLTVWQRRPEHQSRSYTYKRSRRGKNNVTKIQSCHDVTSPRSGELKLLSFFLKKNQRRGKLESIIFSGLLSFLNMTGTLFPTETIFVPKSQPYLPRVTNMVFLSYFYFTLLFYIRNLELKSASPWNCQYSRQFRGRK